MDRYYQYGQYFLILTILDIILSLIIHKNKIFIILLVLSVLLQLCILLSYCYKNNSRITPIIELNNMSENRTILLYCSNIDLYSYNLQYKYKSSLNYIKILKYTYYIWIYIT